MVRSIDKTTGAVECKDIETIFHDCFFHSFRVRLSGGHREPLYLPAKQPDSYAEIRYREDYIASALHETAHWCIAGDARRQLIDFGYWYVPDGRSAQQQRAFEQVEIKPQALEWIFSNAVGVQFHISADNLSNGSQQSLLAFSQAVHAQVLAYLDKGLPARAYYFAEALSGVGKYSHPFDPASYEFSSIWHSVNSTK